MGRMQAIDAVAHPETQIDENFISLEWGAVYGMDPTTTANLVWGFLGGFWGGFERAAGTLALTDNTTNYMVVEIATGTPTMSTSSTNWNNTDLYARVYLIPTSGGNVVAAGLQDHRGGPGGVHGGSGGTGGGSGALMGIQFISDTGSTADSDPGNGLFKWNNASQQLATFLYMDNQSADSNSLTTLLGNLGSTGNMFIQQSDDSTNWQQWKWSAVTDGTGYRKFAVTLEAFGGAIPDAKLCYVDFEADTTVFVAPRVASTASDATPTPNADTTDVYILTALAAGATFGAPTGTPAQGQPLMIRIKDNGTARSLAYNAIFRAIGVSLPTTTVISKTLYIGAIYNSTDTKWDVVSVAQEA